MFVRTVSDRDLDAVRRLLAESLHHTYDAIYGSDRVDSMLDSRHSSELLRRRLELPQSEFLVADDGTELAGVTFARTADDDKTVVLDLLHVRNSRQGEGVGTMLLVEAESCFPDADKVRLEIEEANTAAIRYCLGQGFAKVGEGLAKAAPASEIKTVIFERAIIWAD